MITLKLVSMHMLDNFNRVASQPPDGTSRSPTTTIALQQPLATGPSAGFSPGLALSSDHWYRDFSSTQQCPCFCQWNVTGMFGISSCPSPTGCQSDAGEVWIPPVVQRILIQISQDPTLNHEYLPEIGIYEYTRAATELAIGKESRALLENRVWVLRIHFTV